MKNNIECNFDEMLVRSLSYPEVRGPHSLRIKTCMLGYAAERSVCVVFRDGRSVLTLHRAQDDAVIYINQNPQEVDAILVSNIDFDNKRVSRLNINCSEGDIVFERDMENPCMFTRKVVVEPDPVRVLAGIYAYEKYKQRVFEDGVCVLAGVGTVVGVSGHIHEAFAYGLGGAIGLVYFGQLILQIDNIEKHILERIVSAMRIASLSATVAYMDWRYADMLKEEPALLVWGILGFFSFRIAAVLNKV